MTEKDDETMLCVELSRKVRDILAGKGPKVQGAVLADLVSIWLVGHQKKDREEVFAQWIKLIQDFMPESIKEIFGGGDPPEGWEL